MSDYILEMNKITKEFPGVRALDSVTFQVRKGEIHALIGENGAGKSTLMKILSGLYPSGSYSGEIIVKGETKHFHSIKDSEHAGVAVIYQELALVKQMSVCENIFLGNEIANGGVIDWSQAYVKTREILKEVGLSIDPDVKVLNLGIGKQQLVEIAKALSKKAEILVLDEPTAALNEEDSENLLNILRSLKARGVTCIYISHKLKEVLSIADTYTILRDGKTVCTDPVAQLNTETGHVEKVGEDRIISLMVGRTINNLFPRKAHVPGDVVLEVKNWTVHDPELPERTVIDNANFKVRKGEILGIAGLMGAGRTELAMSLIGAYGVNISGELSIEGKPVRIRNPKHAINLGLSYLTEDRKGSGLVLILDILTNTTLASLKKISKYSVVNKLEEIRETESYVKRMRIKTPSIEQKVMNLSGGNQQKVVLSKWMMTDPKVLILDEPTRGIDVGAKFEIYNIMNDLVDQGVSIIMISSELPEVLGMSDRVIVMHEGTINGELSSTEATQEKAMYFATGGR